MDFPPFSFRYTLAHGDDRAGGNEGRNLRIPGDNRNSGEVQELVRIAHIDQGAHYRVPAARAGDSSEDQIESIDFDRVIFDGPQENAA
jgi:hypothetical protein